MGLIITLIFLQKERKKKSRFHIRQGCPEGGFNLRRHSANKYGGKEICFFHKWGSFNVLFSSEFTLKGSLKDFIFHWQSTHFVCFSYAAFSLSLSVTNQLCCFVVSQFRCWGEGEAFPLFVFSSFDLQWKLPICNGKCTA